MNWNDPLSVNFPRVWRLNYMHPAVRRQKAEDELERAKDCLEDEGLFDFDWEC